MLEINGGIEGCRPREALRELLSVANTVESERAHLAMMRRETHYVSIALRKAQAVRRKGERICRSVERVILHLDHPSLFNRLMQVGQILTSRNVEIFIALQEEVKEINLTLIRMLQGISPIVKHGSDSVNAHHLITLVVKG
jgi:hypothetical protein